MDISKNDSQEAVALFCDSFAHSKNAVPFFLELVKGVIDYKSEIDYIIERFSSNWKIGRMSCVDRNIIRLAVYEMFLCNDIPSKVSINEAIDVGKKFGTEESGAFINGILDSIRIAMEKEEINIIVKASKTN